MPYVFIKNIFAQQPHPFIPSPLIVAMFIGNVDRCMDFFDQSFIRGNGKDEDDEETTEPTPPNS